MCRCTIKLNITRHTRLVENRAADGHRPPSLYINSDGAEHGHGAESPENARYECDCEFSERETLLGEAAGRHA
jgi:hypothetical protein